MKATNQPTPAELEILDVLWTRKKATVREVFEDISKQKTTTYTTVLKTMQIMQEKGLVVRDEKEGDAELPLQRLELGLHLFAQLEVERAQRLVEQLHLRLVDERARQRHTLALAARELAGPALAHAGESHQGQRLPAIAALQRGTGLVATREVESQFAPRRPRDLGGIEAAEPPVGDCQQRHRHILAIAWLEAGIAHQEQIGGRAQVTVEEHQQP